MSEEKSILEILTDEDDVDNLILQNDDGTDVEFEQIATIPLDDRVFAILHPVGVPDVAEDEALVFEWEETDAGESLRVVEDTKLADKVFDEYNALCGFGD